MSRTRWATDFPESDAFRLSFYKVPRVILSMNLLKYATSPERLVFHALLSFRYRNSAVATVGVSKLAASTGLNPATVMKATKELEFQGLVRKLGHSDQGVLRYEVLPYGCDFPPQMPEVVMQRAFRVAKRKCHRPRGDRGRFRVLQGTEPEQLKQRDLARETATTAAEAGTPTPVGVEYRIPVELDTTEKHHRTTEALMKKQSVAETKRSDGAAGECGSHETPPTATSSRRQLITGDYHDRV